jgi:hypothetical protein
MSHDSVALAAAVAHAANAQFCRTLGDASQPPWMKAPAWQKTSALEGVVFHVREFKATGQWPAPSASHASWLRQKENEGWRYGPVKDAALKQHPCCVPFDQLPPAQQAKDYLFGSIVRALYEAGVLS